MMSRHGYGVLNRLEIELLLRAMSLIEAGEWPWTDKQDGTPLIKEMRERAAWQRASTKLHARLARHDRRRKTA